MNDPEARGPVCESVAILGRIADSEGDWPGRPPDGTEGPDRRGILWWDRGWFLVARTEGGGNPEAFLKAYLGAPTARERTPRSAINTRTRRCR